MLILKVLRKSFQFLRENPVAFIPKILSISLWNIAYLYAFYGLHNLESLNIMFLLKLFGLVLLFSPVRALVFAMYVNFSKHYTESNQLKFYDSFKDSLGRVIPILITSVLISTIIGLMIAPTLIIGIIGLVQGDITLLVIGGSLTLLIIIVSSMVFYFAPTGVALDVDSIAGSINQSFNLSKSYTKGILLINLFSGALMLFGFLSTGKFKQLGLAGFLTGRYLSGIIGTYITIVNPQFYLQVSDETD